MAVAWSFRIALRLAVTVTRYCISSGCSTEDFENAYRSYREMLEDITADPDEISAGMSLVAGPEGGASVVVTDTVAPFELRKLQWRLSRAPAGRIEDVDVMNFHFIKMTGGVVGTWNDSTDLAAVETALGTLTTALKGDWLTTTHSDQYRWYKDGPAFYQLNGDGSAFIPIGDNPAIRVTEVDVVGTSSTTHALPPQVALSVTEKTSARKHWGRFYLPVQDGNMTDATGLMSSGQVATTLTPVVAFYNSCRASSVVPVVFSIPKPVRTTASGGSLPAVGGVAYEVTSIQIDDILDIIRSRRYKAGVTKSSTVLT